MARNSYRQRRLVVLAWIALVIGLTVMGGAFGGEAATDFTLPGMESDEASDLLPAGGFPDRGGIAGQVVVAAEGGVDAPAVRAWLEAALADLR